MQNKRKTENEKKKKFLNSYQEAKRAARRIEVQIEELQQNKLSPRCFSGDGLPHGSNMSDLSDYAAKLDELERDLLSARYHKINEFQKVRQAIEEMNDEEEKDLLTFRYLKGCGWSRVASEMNCAVRTAHNIHGSALQHLKEHIEQQDENF